MIGFPKTLSTKQDYLNCIELYPQETKEALQTLLDDRFIWKNNGEIETGATPIQDASHKILQTEDGKICQLELIDDAYSKIYRIGFSVEEVENLIKGE